MKKVIASCFAFAISVQAFAQSDVAIVVGQFGVGGHARPGDVTGIRLKLTSDLDDPTPVWVQWEVPNADGDIAEYGRSLSLMPGRASLVWLYAPLPPSTDISSVWTVRVFEERDGERNRELGGSRIGITSTNAQLVDMTATLVAVVGDRRLGLETYGVLMGMQTPRPIASHENTRVASGLDVSELPDRWEGYLPFHAVAWSSDRDPQNLSIDQADALREYVRRGGHLIISLPAVGDPWGLGSIGKTQLEEMLPCRTPGELPRRDESVPLLELLPILSKSSSIEMHTGGRPPPEFTIRVFKDLNGSFDVIDNHYEPLIALPDGRVVVIQRWFGFGRISVLGVDVNDGRLPGLGLPQGDAFWNRILGRRDDTPTLTEQTQIESAGRLARGSVPDHALGSGRLMTEEINMPGRAGKGLLLALFLFVIYFLTAGPVGFHVLKRYKQEKHAWAAFAACAGVFTAIAWGSVGLISERVEVRHVSILDHVARRVDEAPRSDPQYQRAVSYFSVYLPKFGLTPIAIDSLPEQRDLLLTFNPPGEPAQWFPNPDRYAVDVSRSQSSYRQPSRSTAAQFYANWLGGLSQEWGGMLRVTSPIREQRQLSQRESPLTGTIVNDLPGALRDVRIIYVQSNRLPRRTYQMTGRNVEPWVPPLRSGQLLNAGRMWSPGSTTWEPGQVYSLDEQLRMSATETRGIPELGNNIYERYVKELEDRGLSLGAPSGPITTLQRRKYMEMLSMFGVLNPPKYLKLSEGERDPPTVTFRRVIGRELDLSAWFTRPCVIIIGYLNNSELPVPLMIDGKRVNDSSEGVTMVRWIYPLPLDEKEAFTESFQESDGQAN